MQSPRALPALFLIPALSAAWLGTAASLGPWALLASLAAPVVLIGTLSSTRWSLVALIALMPYATSGISFRILNFAWPALILAGFALALLHRREQPGSLPAPLRNWFALFLVWAAVASLASDHLLPSLGTVARYGWTGLLLIAVVTTWSRRQFEIAYKLFVLACIPIAVIGLGQFVSAGPAEFFLQKAVNPERLASIYNNPNTLGLMMAHGLIILSAFAISRGGNRRWAGWVSWTVLVLLGLLFATSIAVSLSRSAYIYATVGIAILVWSRASRRTRWFGLAAVPSLGLLTMMSLPDWLSTLLRLGAGASSRIHLWQSGWRMMLENPWVGVGPGSGTFEAHRQFYMNTSAQLDLTWTKAGAAHNVFLTKGAELGWPGLIIVAGLFILIWRRLPNALREYRQGNWVLGAAAAALAGLSVRALVESGGTLSLGHPTDSLLFLSFALLVLTPTQDAGARVACPADEFRSGRTGGQRVWSSLIQHFQSEQIPLVTEDDHPVPTSLKDKPLPLLFWYNSVYGRLRRGVLFVDQSQSGRLALLTRRLRDRRGVRLVVLVQHLRDSFRLTHPLYVRFATWNENQLLRSAHRVIVHTQVEAALVVDRGVQEKRIAIVPLGHPGVSGTVSVRTLSDQEPLRLLWIGGDFERKGLPLLLEALTEVPDPKPILTVVGKPHDGDIAARMRHRVAELGLDNHVAFLGRVSDSDYATLWDEHDVFVLPSLHEGHGLALDEALARGLPALVSDLPVFRERLDMEDAVFVEPGNRVLLTRAMLRLRSDSIRRDLSTRGIRRAATFPQWHDTLAGYAAIIREELARADDMEKR